MAEPQRSLFTPDCRGRETAVSRLPVSPDDPSTSLEAAIDLAASGALTAQQEETLGALRAYERTWGTAPTSHELAGDDLAARYLYARRLPELERQGRVRKGARRVCRVTGRAAMTWEGV